MMIWVKYGQTLPLSLDSLQAGDTVTFEQANGASQTFVVNKAGKLEPLQEPQEASRRFAAAEAEDAEVLWRHLFLLFARNVPPVSGEPRRPRVGLAILAALAPAERRQAVLGDIIEQFDANVAKHGQRTARFILHQDVFWSVAPLAWRAIKRLSIWGLIADGARRIFLG